MIQQGTNLNIIDNSGAKCVSCIKVLNGYKSRYAFVGDVVVVSVKSLRSKRKLNAKVKKGSIQTALIIRSKFKVTRFTNDKIYFFENSAIILTKKNKVLGTRIFGVLPHYLRQTRYLKLISLSSGVVY